MERSHQTLKSILKKFALLFGTDWEDNLPYFLFVLRDSPSESTGFSRVLYKFLRYWELAAEHMDEFQSRAELRFDRRAVQREFVPGDRVLVLLPHRGVLFEVNLGPIGVLRKVSDANCVVCTPGRRRPYVSRRLVLKKKERRKWPWLIPCRRPQ